MRHPGLRKNLWKLSGSPEDDGGETAPGAGSSTESTATAQENHSFSTDDGGKVAKPLDEKEFLYVNAQVIAAGKFLASLPFDRYVATAKTVIAQRRFGDDLLKKKATAKLEQYAEVAGHLAAAGAAVRRMIAEDERKAL
jgi:hypothetical protein